jgi:hypothetical protein
VCGHRGADDAKAEIRAAVGYLLRGAIVRQVASGLPLERGNALDDGFPGG